MTVVNVEKEINICLNEVHSKLLFVDHAAGEIRVLDFFSITDCFNYQYLAGETRLEVPTCGVRGGLLGY